MWTSLTKFVVPLVVLWLLAAGAALSAKAQSVGDDRALPGEELPGAGDDALKGEDEGEGKAAEEAEGDSEAAGNTRGPTDPLAIVGAKIPDTTLGRARMRDSLYALLATADDEDTAKRIEQRLERLWRMPGSPTVALLLDRANRKLSEKKPDVAQKFLDAAVDLAPDFAEAWNRRAFIHYERGDLRSAVGDLRRVLALDPNHYLALNGLATIMAEIGDDEAALQALEKILEIHPFRDGIEKRRDELRQKVRGQRL